MISNLQTTYVTTDSVTPEQIQEWFAAINTQNSHQGRVAIPKALAFYIKSVFTYWNSRQLNETEDTECLYLSVEEPTEDLQAGRLADSYCTSTGPEGAIVIFLSDKKLAASTNPPQLLADYLQEQFPESVIGYDDIYTWFDFQLINTSIFRDSDIILVRARTFFLPDGTEKTIEEILTGYLAYLAQHLEYQEE